MTGDDYNVLQLFSIKVKSLTIGQPAVLSKRVYRKIRRKPRSAQPRVDG